MKDYHDRFLDSLKLPEGFEAKRYNGMNRVHFKYHGVGFAVMDMKQDCYNLGSRDDYYKSVHVNKFEHINYLGPNHALIRDIPYSDTSVLYALFDYIADLWSGR